MLPNCVSLHVPVFSPPAPQGYKTRNYFTATQGPLANTINDFWLMIWQSKSACIVMLCDTMEEDKVCSLSQGECMYMTVCASSSGQMVLQFSCLCGCPLSERHIRTCLGQCIVSADRPISIPFAWTTCMYS